MAMNDPDESKALVATEIRVPATLDPAAGSTNPFGRAIVAPKVVSDAGDRAARRFANFFGSIENDNTRAAYQRACSPFFVWCHSRDLALADIEPIHVGAYVKPWGRNSRSRPSSSISPPSRCCSTGSWSDKSRSRISASRQCAEAK